MTDTFTLRCSKCKETKSCDEFPKNRASKTGYYNYCKPCNKEIARKWKANNKEKHRASSKRWAEANPERKRHGQLLIKYGITLDQYNEMLNKQKFVCSICHKADLNKNLAVDHCHKTGKVRELLCQKCNQGLGNFLDNPDLLRKAIDYLTRHQ